MRETIIRSLSGLTYILFLSVAVFYSSVSLRFFFSLVCCWAVLEYCKLVQLKYYLPLLLAVISIFTCTTPHAVWIQTILTSLAFIGVLYGTYFLFSKQTNLSTSFRWFLLVGYIIAPFLLLMGIPYTEQGYKPDNLYAFFIIIWINDTFAFLVGKTFGKNKLMEHISPKKTIEGFAGGFIFATIAGYALALFYLDDNTVLWTIAAILISIIGPIGDLFESKLKRLAGVKDSGYIMPGHGGVLDRMDSVIFTVPFVFLLLQLANYVS